MLRELAARRATADRGHALVPGAGGARGSDRPRRRVLRERRRGRHGGAPEVHAWLTDGLSDKGRAELLRNALEVNCTDGDVVIAAGDGGRFLGFVLDGVVEVKAEERVVRMLGEGELFGEIALVLDRPRTVDIVAAGDDTRVLLLSQTALTRLSSGADQAQVWRNIAKVLARRLPYTT